jgi:hypothetical protein
MKSIADVAPGSNESSLMHATHLASVAGVMRTEEIGEAGLATGIHEAALCRSEK